MASKPILFLTAGVLAIAAAGVWLIAGRDAPSAASEASSRDEESSGTVQPDDEQPRRQAPSPSIRAASPAGHPEQAKMSKSELRRKRRAIADELRKKLAALGYGRKAAGAQAEPAQPAARIPGPVGSGNQAKEAMGQYIQEVVREQFQPVAGSCYEELLERKPDAAGDVVLELSIVGSDDLGGVVEEVQVQQDGTTFTDDEFLTCVRESMYTTTFDAPPDGKNSITVTYPFSFAP